MSIDIATEWKEKLTPEKPVTVFERDGQSIHWVGVMEDTAFRCNAYLLTGGGKYLLIDPGGAGPFFEQVRNNVSLFCPPDKIDAVILCHQDPDVAASLPQWLELNPALKVYASPRANVLLPHFGRRDYDFHDITCETYVFPGGRSLKFIESPFLHSQAAFATFDNFSGYLFSGDIWAALDIDWRLVVSDFQAHMIKMNLFHLDYMASNAAARGFVHRIKNIAIRAILPQHGSIITRKDVPAALAYLEALQCGIDIAYAGG